LKQSLLLHHVSDFALPSDLRNIAPQALFSVFTLWFNRSTCWKALCIGKFLPRKFYPQDWAVLARLAGIKYVVFTAKHHSGFCMFDTATTEFNIMKTPFRRDITSEILTAFREQGIVPGLYFSPDDFWWLYMNGKTLQRNMPDVAPANNPGPGSKAGHRGCPMNSEPL
jgi:hypothetical protein